MIANRKLEENFKRIDIFFTKLKQCMQGFHNIAKKIKIDDKSKPKVYRKKNKPVKDSDVKCNNFNPDDYFSDVTALFDNK